MGIQPIDLQTIYAQMEKVGKMQAAEQSSAVNNRELQEQANKLDAQRRLDTVKNSENINNEKISIGENTRGGNSASYSRRSFKNKAGETDEGEEGDDYIKDPKLGTRVDISG